MTSSYDRPVLLVIGAGPGLGLSVARRFGKEGYAVALVSRSTTRHAGFLATLADSGVEAAAFAADVTDPARLRAAVDGARERFGRIDALWFGPGGVDGPPPGDIRTIDVAQARGSLEAMVLPAVDAVAQVLPAMRERGSGALLFAGGLSSVLPMPPLGALALAAAALRNHALTLHAALAAEGVYAGTLTIGGLVERGDIHAAVTANPELFGGAVAPTLDPDDLADTVWRMVTDRTEPEVVVTAPA
jgi:NADP-dependent 3-hydroxy acid dehydrogenase YdfG